MAYGTLMMKKRWLFVLAELGGTLAPLPEPDQRPTKPETRSVNHFPKIMVSELSWAHKHVSWSSATTWGWSSWGGCFD
jgi:hypothetical protein